MLWKNMNKCWEENMLKKWKIWNKKLKRCWNKLNPIPYHPNNYTCSELCWENFPQCSILTLIGVRHYGIDSVLWEQTCGFLWNWPWLSWCEIRFACWFHWFKHRNGIIPKNFWWLPYFSDGLNHQSFFWQSDTTRKFNQGPEACMPQFPLDILQGAYDTIPKAQEL